MVKRALFLFVVLAGLLAAPPLAQADEDGCTVSLLQCYERAAKIDSFWYRWAAGLDCEFEFAGCVRKTLMGL